MAYNAPNRSPVVRASSFVEEDPVSLIFVAVRAVLVGGAAVYLARQVKKPDRYVGPFFARIMNTSHSALTDWSLTRVTMPPNATALDVGCGGGRTIEKLARTAGTVYGIDYAPGSVAASRSHNQQLISEKRVGIEQASVSKLPFPANFFDVVTAVETQYYWPDLVNDMREILRVLKPGGQLMIAAETYQGGGNDWLLGPVMRLLGSHRLSLDDHRALFRQAGFTDIQIAEERHKGWICATGRKP